MSDDSTISPGSRRLDQFVAVDPGTSGTFDVKVDRVTGALEERAFEYWVEQVLDRAASTASRIALVRIVPESFEKILLRHGRASSDSVMMQLAQRARTCIRNSDVMGMVGTDQIAVLLDACDHIDAANAVLHRMATVYRSPFAVEGKLIELNVRLGVAYSPDQANDAKRLFAIAMPPVQSAEH